MKRQRKTCLLFTIFIIAAMLTGCSKFNCSGYIQAMLDSIYKGQHTAYAEMTYIDATELAQNYEEGINAEIEALISYMNIGENSSFVNEDTRSNARELFKKIYHFSNYDVGEADDDGYVTVTIHPINIYQLANEELTIYNKDFYTRNDNGEFATVDDEAFYSTYIQGVINILNKYIDNIGYNAPQNITVHVVADEQNIYSITEDEFLQLDRYIIDYTQ